jgi:hypothetical protein
MGYTEEQARARQQEIAAKYGSSFGAEDAPPAH